MSSLNALFLITHLSSIISKCSIYDTACLSSLTQIYATTVIPGGTGFGIESLDPMMLDTVGGEHDGLSYEMSDIELSGFKHALVDKVQFNKEHRKTYFKLRVPNLTIFCNYTSKGFVRSVPFNGDGKLIFELFDVEFELMLNYEILRSKDGKEHIKYHKDFTYWFDMRYAETYIENVNKDDPIRAAEVQELVKHQYRILWQQYGRRIMDGVTDRIAETVHKVMMIIPADHILTDYN